MISSCAYYEFMYSKIVVLNQSIETEKKAQALAKRLNLVLNPDALTGCQFSLSFEEGRLVLSWIGKKHVKPIWVDLSQINLKRASMTDALIAKAVGVKMQERPSVLDACAGLGMDAFTLALLGCKVTLLERSPIMFELLKDALTRISEMALKETPTLLFIDAIAYLNQIDRKAYPDVIYLDPMYPERHKNALAKKEMQMLQDLVGEDLDAPALLEKALFCAKKRVVVKRRRLDQSLGDRKPDFVFTGKAVRFDVYLSCFKT